MMRNLIRTLTTAAVLITAGCTNKTEPKPPAAGGDAESRKALRSYVVELLRRNPTTNTYLGGAGFDPSLRDVDGALRDYSATALADEDQIYALRAEAAKLLGDKFSAKAFHVLFISQGTIPPGYFHDTLLNRLRRP